MRNHTTIPLLAVVAIGIALFAVIGCDESKPSGPGVGPETAASATAPTSAPSASSNPSAQPSSSATSTDSASGSGKSTASSAAPTTKTKTKTKTKPKTKTKTKTTTTPPTRTTAAPKTTSAPVPTTTPPTPTVKLPTLKPPKAGSADAVAAKVDKVYLPIVRFKADFKQKYKTRIAGTTKKSFGTVLVQRPGKISFTYREPNKNRVVSDGTTLKVYEHENNQMFIKSVANTEYPGALAFIMGKGLRTSFTFTFHKKTKWEGGPVIMGKPRVPNPGYKKVLFYIDEALLNKGDAGCVRRVLVVDAQSNQNRFDFIRVEQPTSIPASTFTFTAPKGTNILK